MSVVEDAWILADLLTHGDWSELSCSMFIQAIFLSNLHLVFLLAILAGRVNYEVKMKQHQGIILGLCFS